MGNQRLGSETIWNKMLALKLHDIEQVFLVGGVPEAAIAIRPP